MLSFFDNYNIVAMVGDSYDIYHFCNLLGEMKEEIIEKTKGGKTLVVRPDSGDPTVVPIEVVQILAEKFGYTVNSKGYKVLHPSVRVIQGDGINENTLPIILDNLLAAGFSADNIAFGMGGGLLAAWNRDTLRYAMKASARRDANGVWHEIRKNPVTDPGKVSKAGRLGLLNQCGIGVCGYHTVPENIAVAKNNVLRTVFENGVLLVDEDFGTIRKRAELKEIEYLPRNPERF
jgi:nicotinamide phosphoribosyltransferase